MSNTLNGIVGESAHFAGDYLFRETALPNNETIYSEEHTLNNTLGRLQLTGTLDQSLTMAAGNMLTVELQYKDGTNWQTLHTLLSRSGTGTISAGTIFEYIPAPSETRRDHRIQVTSNFDASAVKLTAVIETLPLG